MEKYYVWRNHRTDQALMTLGRLQVLIVVAMDSSGIYP